MLIQLPLTESGCKEFPPPVSSELVRPLANRTGMPPKEPRDAPVSAYVKMRLRALERSGTDQKEIAKRAAVAPSLVNQLLRTPQGVGPRSADRWARFLGFPDAFAMNREVERWWKAHLPDELDLVGPGIQGSERRSGRRGSG